MNWEPSMDPYELRESIGENLEETCQHGDKAFPCAGYRDHYRRGREGYPWHWHDEWEIAFVEQGQVRAQVNGEQHLLGPGEGIFINRRVLHAFSLEGNGEVWMPNLLFLPSLLYGSQESVFWEKYAKPLAFSTGCTHLALRQDVPWQREALAQAGRAYALLEKAAYGYELRVRSALSEVLVALAGHLPELPSQPSRNQAEIRRVRQMLTFIQGHYTQPLRVEDIAASVFISRRECMRAFQNVLGISPIQYVLQLRVRKAKELLLETGLSLGEICAACGFQGQSYFTKAFRERTGTTPGKFREGK